jgi:hypothetical protein
VNGSRYFGLAAFKLTVGVSIETELGADFMTLLQDRWESYDLVISTTPKLARLPTTEIISVLTHRLDLADPLVTHGLSMDFLRQLDLVKRTAMEIGILT